MRQFWLYSFVSRAKWMNYRAKIMLMAFVGTHVPLLALIAYFVVSSGADFWTGVSMLVVALGATLAGTGVTLFVLDQLLRPIMATSRGLRLYRRERTLPTLPTHFTDEAGTLMADAQHTLEELDSVIDDLAYYDRVTRLPNRDRFLTELSDRIAKATPFAVAAIRINAYDTLAGTFDQVMADKAIVRLSEAMKAASGGRAFLARVDASMFAAAFAAADDVETLASEIRARMHVLSDEMRIDGIAVMPDPSLGVALFPEDATDATALLDSAVAAIAPTTAGEKAPVRFFSPRDRETARARFLTEQELRHALDHNEFRLHYQPVVDVGLGRIVGCEALVRWQHPDRGLVGPGTFIPIAEATGLIDPIGRWVLREASQQVRAWQKAGRDDLKVAINISARQFRDPALADLITRSVRDNNLGAGNLEVELTETAAMQDREHAARMFHELRDAGVSIAIDDFGTGYSSMSHLLDLPFDRLKIDRQFVSGIDASRNAHAICSALVALAGGLRAEVLAEGVETAAEVRALRELGCREFQGFYFGRPMTPEAFIIAANDLTLTADLMRAAEGIDTPETLRRIA